MNAVPCGAKKYCSGGFFERPVCDVAHDLLGKFLVRQIDRTTCAYLIVETEAYGGENDQASHARFGETTRNAPMYAQAGTIYVYLSYGMHWMLNITTGRRGEPLGKAAGLWIEDRGKHVLPHNVRTSPRIGVGYAGEWADKPWRFILRASERTPSPRETARQSV